jgi:hypothetical protein
MNKSKAVGAMCIVSALTMSLLAPAQAAEEEEAGNNLSFPVLWAEVEGRPTLPGVFDEDKFEGEILAGTLTPDSDTTCWAAVQKNINNSWQAENLDAGPDHSVTTIDWGDNLEVKDWNVGSPVRVETGLFDDTLPAPMKQYQMCYVSGQGPSEIWGARVSGPNGTVSPSLLDGPSAMVFTAGARLTIQRIVDPTQSSWDVAAKRWVGSGTTDPIFNSAVYEKASDGPGSYGAELNVQGKLIYGFNWATSGLYNGEYRITFSLDGASDAFPTGSGTSLNGASILVSEETEEPVTILEAQAGSGSGSGGGHGGGSGGGSGGEAGGNEAVVLGDLNLTYIDVALSGGEDAPADNGGGTTPPPSGGTTSPPAASPPLAPPTGVDAPGGPGEEQPVQVGGPEFAQAKVRQTARIRAPRSGNYKLGQTLVLTPQAVKTSAGVTVRWRAKESSKDNCIVQNRNGRVTAKLIKLGTCRVIAYAPAPSPIYLRYRETRTYRVVS